MLRVVPGKLRRSEAIHVPPITMRRRAGIPLPVVPQAPDQTIAVRGLVDNGSPAALILEPTGVCVVSFDRSRRRRVRRFTIPEILVVESHRHAQGAELVIVTATTDITVVDVDIAQAWSFCREVQRRILESR